MDEAFSNFPPERILDLYKWAEKHKGKFPLPRQTATVLSKIKKDHFNRYQFAVDLIKSQKSKKILDAGCGIGYGSHLMANYVETIDCVDISTHAEEVFNNHYKLPNINFIRSDILEARLNPPYDLIVCFEFLEHNNKPDEVLSLFSMLSDVLIMSVPNEALRPFDPTVHVTHIQHFTFEQIEEQLNEHNFITKAFYSQKSKYDPQINKGIEGEIILLVAEKAKT